MINGKQRYWMHCERLLGKAWVSVKDLGHAYCSPHEAEAIAWRRAALLGVAIADPGLRVRVVHCGHSTHKTTPLATSRRRGGPNGSRHKRGSSKRQRDMSSRRRPS